MINFLPSAATPLADRILGEHLRHLRECQDVTVAAVAERLPADLRPAPETLTAAEAGHHPLLRTTVLAGEGLALARAYGAGQHAADDWQTCVLGHQQHLAAGFTRDCFIDCGFGWPHRYQVVEERAGSILIAGSHQLPPVPLRTPAVEEAVWEFRPGARSRHHRERASLGALPGTGCRLCQPYSADLLTDWSAVEAWQREAHRVRTAVFAARVRAPGAPSTVVLLDEMLLHRRVGGARLHTGQMEHLAHLAETTSLEIRVVPMSACLPNDTDRVQLDLPEGALTVTLSEMDAVYEDLVDPRLADLLRHALEPKASLDMIRRAADGTLSTPW
ncbi:Scr1 family TA system antitoxin-like transcriptional regulator [Kitasatospora sp. NPDC058046]|uniref:Scr1 family TA system antitoxin-like transcriptional regulator n=1 Tax=Kitasatospora sp. NPDC058046 TaxID=3346312 RepID=UPI0036D77AA7